MDTERFMYLDTVLTLTSNRAGSGEMMGLLDPGLATQADSDSGAFAQFRSAQEGIFRMFLTGTDVNATLRYGNAMYDDMIAALRPETHQARRGLLDQIESRVKQNAAEVRGAAAIAKLYLFSSREELGKVPGKVLTALLVPALLQVETAQTRTEAHVALLQGAFLAQSQLVEKEQIPLSPDELGSGAAGLTDPFTGGSIGMVADQRGLVLYSVGPNGVDEGGKRTDEQHGADDIRVILPVAP
jgi:hypothetical protein